MGTGGLRHFHFFGLDPWGDMQDKTVLGSKEPGRFGSLGRLLFHIVVSQNLISEEKFLLHSPEFCVLNKAGGAEMRGTRCEFENPEG